MKNLSLCKITLKNVDLCFEDAAYCFCYNKFNLEGLYICLKNLLVCKYVDGIEWSKDISLEFDIPNKPVNMTYLQLSNSLCIGLSNGELCTIDSLGEKLEIVGVFDTGIMDMSWSPDQDLLILVTKNYKMVLMNYTFDVIQENDLLEDVFGEKQFVTVGWGKKETQFHGREGKKAASEKLEIDEVQDPIDHDVRITWRGDGALCAVGFINNGITQFKIFDREGNLQWASEKHKGIKNKYSWRPSGNLIATVQNQHDKNYVAFFEKNGLKHGEFLIPISFEVLIEDLLWSIDSEILTVQSYNPSTKQQFIMLFIISNHHWYLKQTLTFDSQNKINKIFWDDNFEALDNKTIHIVLENGQIKSYTWIWDIAHSTGVSDNDDGIVTVIDGNKLLITGFRQSVVPPPLAALEVTTDENINFVSFLPQTCDQEHTNNFCVYSYNGRVSFYKQTNKNPMRYEKYGHANFNNSKVFHNCFDWLWLDTDIFVTVMLDTSEHYKLLIFTVENEQIIIKYEVSLPSSVRRICSHPKEKSVFFLHLEDGKIMHHKIDEGLELVNVTFPSPCSKFDVVFVEDLLYFIGLSVKGNLYLNNKVVLKNVSSYYIHSHFLLLTTLQHLMLCTELSKQGLDSISDSKTDDSSIVYKREIERGATLVTAIANDTRVVFQMPRGNLEAIQPRPLSLRIIGDYLDSLKYYEAFDLMRKQRINLNLIYDHNPERFIDHIDVFLDAITNNSWLNLFISELENTDVTFTMYSSSYPDKVQNDHDSKVEKVCELLQTRIEKRSDAKTKILPLLTTYVKKNTIADLEKALVIVKIIKADEGNNILSPVSSDEALKYLLYMVDVNKMFDVALGMYDFDLVLFVANKSQKDPKEYVSMLNEFNTMEENYKRFSINKYLKRFDLAVAYLAKCNDKKNEFLSFIKYHSLYKTALQLFSKDDDIYKQILEDYGSYLKLQKHYLEAGIIFDRAKNYHNSIECYKEALEWNLALRLADSILSKENFNILCWDLINALKIEKRHTEALTILERYCNRKDTLVYLIECGDYKTAFGLCSRENDDHFIESNLLPALEDDYKNTMAFIECNMHDFVKYKQRLKVVREKKKENSINSVDDVYTHRDSDLYSESGSTIASSVSRSSSKTFRSSKNRRKHERKVTSLKEGSQYEDVALIIALYNLITATCELRFHVKNINITLKCLDRDKEASALQTTLCKALIEQKNGISEIWTNEFLLEATNAAINAQNNQNLLPQGLASLEPKMRIAPVIQEVFWELQG